MNEIVNKFLLIDDKFMPEMHLKQPRFTYSHHQLQYLPQTHVALSGPRSSKYCS